MKNYFENPELVFLPHGEIKGKKSWKSPSNIAFIKYWGKYDIQLPKNASLSMTLSHAFTQTDISYCSTKVASKRNFLFEGKSHDEFSKRIWKFLDSLHPILPFLNQLDLHIESKNSFPHSAGIASSASAMSALALCLVDIERSIFGTLTNEKEFYEKASYIARLGSGSAARSVFGGFTIWGETNINYLKTNNHFAVEVKENIHPNFQELQDAILIVDEGQKKVSSSLGHSLMDKHPYTDNRITQANNHISELTKTLTNGDQKSFIRIVESEALSLHALMMSSDPWFILMKPQTLDIIEKIKSYRKKSGKFIAFTLDAGPNVHLLYNRQDENEIKIFIEKELKPHCYQNHIIFDEMGKGPEKIK